MKKSTLLIASFLATLSFTSLAQAGDAYIGGGFPGRLNLGYATKVSPNFGVRGELSGGTNLSISGNQAGVDMVGKLKSSSVGAYADWYPVATSGFRLVGGLTVNDTSFALNATGNGSATFNGQSVNMSGEYYNVTAKMPSVTPYLGVGYGHNRTEKGFGFFADLGVMIGSPDVSSSTSLVTNGKATQADVDAQTQKVRDATNKYGFLPKFTIGTTYTF